MDTRWAPASKRSPSAAASVTGRPRFRSASGRTTAPGYQSRDGQTVVRSTGLAGNDHGQTAYVRQRGGCTQNTVRTVRTFFSAVARQARAGLLNAAYFAASS